MKKELKLKHIAPYLPYKLQIQMIDPNLDKGILNTIHEVDLIHRYHDTEQLLFKLKKYDMVPFVGRGAKPILHPLSDLVKKIEHNGKKFVPMEELFKIHIDVKNDSIIKYEKTKFYTDIPYSMEFLFSNKDIGIYKEASSFYYDILFNSFYFCINGTKDHVSNQLNLFQKLFEWNIDVFRSH